MKVDFAQMLSAERLCRFSEMEYAFFATFLFAWSVSCARQSTKFHGPNVANSGRILVALIFFSLVVLLTGRKPITPGWEWLVLSGALGLGIGDIALFHALPRIGPALSILIMQCLAAPFALSIEYLMLGTTITWVQAGSALVIFCGVIVALGSPPEGAEDRQQRRLGIALAVLAGIGQACGAVSTPLAKEACIFAGEAVPDGVSQGFVRVLGGAPIVLGFALWQSRGKGFFDGVIRPYPKLRSLSWMTMNGLSGPGIGVACYQWALTLYPAGIVLSIVATSPIFALPMQWATEGKRPGARAWIGASIAVAGLILLRQTG